MSNLFDRMKLFVQRDKEFRSALYDIMGFFPHNVELYRIAFAHKSQEYKSKKTGDRPLNNERLEFLGDAVLETVVSDIVYHHFKNKREGFLTNTRSKIVSRESLGKLAKDLGIDRLIQSHTNSKAHNSFLAGNAFEALMGAIYLDRGFDYAFRFIEHRIMGTVLDLEGVAHKEVNFKSKLLEWSQKNRIRIDFKDKQQAASSSSTPTFFTTIILEGLFAGDGKGFSKKEAHQNASKDALTRMRREPKFIDEIFTSKEKRTAMEADPCFVLPVIDEIEADLAREAENQGKAKKEQHRENAKKQPKQETKIETHKEQPKKEQPKSQQKKEQPKTGKTAPKQAVERAEKQTSEAAKAEATHTDTESVDNQKDSLKPTAPIVIPIAFEDILPEHTDENSATEETNALETDVVEPVVTVQPTAEEPARAATPTAAAPSVEESLADNASADENAAMPALSTVDDAAPADTATPATSSKKPRRRGKRQNAAGFTNTETIPAEMSHRADKAAKKVEEAKKEKARKNARKSARAAAKGIEETPGVTPNQGENTTADVAVIAATPAGNTDATAAGEGAKTKKRSTGKKSVKADEAAEQPAAKKPRRRRKTKAELPSETPNPEREQAITAAENAAYQQSNSEE